MRKPKTDAEVNAEFDRRMDAIEERLAAMSKDLAEARKEVLEIRWRLGLEVKP